MKAYLLPLALLAALVMATNASAGVFGQPQAEAPAVQAADGSCVACCCDPCCCTPILNALRNARARLACLVAPPCCVVCKADPCCRPVLSRVRAAMCVPSAVLCRVKAALCCPPVCCDPCAAPAQGQ